MASSASRQVNQIQCCDWLPEREDGVILLTQNSLFSCRNNISITFQVKAGAQKKYSELERNFIKVG